jgi:hypothetical protein
MGGYWQGEGKGLVGEFAKQIKQSLVGKDRSGASALPVTGDIWNSCGARYISDHRRDFVGWD